MKGNLICLSVWLSAPSVDHVAARAASSPCWEQALRAAAMTMARDESGCIIYVRPRGTDAVDAYNRQLMLCSATVECRCRMSCALLKVG